MRTSEKVNEIVSALAKVQGNIPSVKKDTKAYKYSYATLASIWEPLRPLLLDNGLFITQDALTIVEGTSVSTRIFHTSGQWLEFGPLVIPMGKKDAHSTGSAITYAKRYQLSAALGIVTEDDDGAAAQEHAPPPQAPVAPSQAPVAPLPKVNVDDWVTTWSKKYDKNLILEYIKARSEHLKHNASVTVSQLASNSDLFEKNLKIWIANKEKDDSEK